MNVSDTGFNLRDAFYLIVYVLIYYQELSFI